MKKRILALVLAGVLGVSVLTGCSGINKGATIATANGMEVSMGVANFYCRLQQASAEDMYKSYFGDDVWNQDLAGNGTTMQESLKESALEELHEMYTLQQHMGDYGVELTEEEKTAITEAATAFMSGNSNEAVQEMGATQEIVEEFLTLFTIREKMQDAIEADADVQVSDEEANMRGYTKLEIAIDSHTDEDGNSVDYTEDEVTALKAQAEEMVAALAEEGATLESVAEDFGYKTTTETYATYEAEATEGEDEDTDTEEDPVEVALKGMAEGEVSGVIETEDALYIVRVDSDTDEEATESNRESIISERQSAYYDEVLAGWQEEDGWEVDSKLLAKIQFKNSLTTVDPNAAENADVTESAE